MSLEQQILLWCLATMATVLVAFVLWFFRDEILRAVLRPFAPILRPLVRPLAERFWAREEARLKAERQALIRKLQGRAPEDQDVAPAEGPAEGRG